MKMSHAEKITRCFDDAEEEFGEDKSTEFLLAITADRMNCDYEDVVEALAMTTEHA